MQDTLNALRISLAQAIMIRKGSLYRTCKCGPIHICEARELIKNDPYLLEWQKAHDRALEELTHNEGVDDDKSCTAV